MLSWWRDREGSWLGWSPADGGWVLVEKKGRRRRENVSEGGGGACVGRASDKRKAGRFAYLPLATGAARVKALRKPRKRIEACWIWYIVCFGAGLLGIDRIKSRPFLLIIWGRCAEWEDVLLGGRGAHSFRSGRLLYPNDHWGLAESAFVFGIKSGIRSGLPTGEKKRHGRVQRPKSRSGSTWTQGRVHTHSRARVTSIASSNNACFYMDHSMPNVSCF